jgi:aspartate/methionine/tyrosine aminotransferase
MNRAENLPLVASRMANIDAFHVMEVQARANWHDSQGRPVVHMEIGQPDFAAPPQVVEAAIESMRTQSLGYTDSLGIPALRRAISDFYRSREGVEVDPDRIIITTGASGAFLLLFGALIDKGGEVLMPDPCYPCNRHFVRMFDGIPRLVASGADQLYQLRAQDIRDHWSPAARGVLLATPSNPTGTMVQREELRAIIDEVRSRDGFMIVDEIYRGLVYGDAPPSALTLADDIFVVNSFSKYFNMTGWRLGWIVAPEKYVRTIEKLAQNAFICPPATAQYAALAGFRPDTIEVLEQRRAEFQRRRDFLVPALRDLGFSIPVMPQGAFYVYAGCETFSPDSQEFALRVLDEAKVAITPGIDFGPSAGRKHVRFAYTRSYDDMQEAVRRLGKFLRA